MDTSEFIKHEIEKHLGLTSLQSISVVKWSEINGNPGSHRILLSDGHNNAMIVVDERKLSDEYFKKSALHLKMTFDDFVSRDPRAAHASDDRESKPL